MQMKFPYAREIMCNFEKMYNFTFAFISISLEISMFLLSLMSTTYSRNIFLNFLLKFIRLEDRVH